ncbi:uncharacterized protein KGF55_003196 [Candida pseudojiufengensis]|uniref:uncharacterized protein n=1 Tax=Candida pseudojiufengensis TaxID=497109 RepID=UPI002224EC9B|nr:uncharacterized protein KGF55_003196 [Candida pseudojiufengensis]KAI5962120.1 hypothetical protein KGF55_003196 [Candida pseudojiufengensis]
MTTTVIKYEKENMIKPNKRFKNIKIKLIKLKGKIIIKIKNKNNKIKSKFKKHSNDDIEIATIVVKENEIKPYRTISKNSIETTVEYIEFPEKSFVDYDPTLMIKSDSVIINEKCLSNDEIEREEKEEDICQSEKLKETLEESTTLLNYNSTLINPRRSSIPKIKPPQYSSITNNVTPTIKFKSQLNQYLASLEEQEEIETKPYLNYTTYINKINSKYLNYQQLNNNKNRCINYYWLQLELERNRWYIEFLSLALQFLSISIYLYLFGKIIIYFLF